MKWIVRPRREAIYHFHHPFSRQMRLMPNSTVFYFAYYEQVFTVRGIPTDSLFFIHFPQFWHAPHAAYIWERRFMSYFIIGFHKFENRVTLHLGAPSSLAPFLGPMQIDLYSTTGEEHSDKSIGKLKLIGTTERLCLPKLTAQRPIVLFHFFWWVDWIFSSPALPDL